MSHNSMPSAVESECMSQDVFVQQFTLTVCRRSSRRDMPRLTPCPSRSRAQVGDQDAAASHQEEAQLLINPRGRSIRYIHRQQ
jgi:hypothetical protein